MNKFQKALDNYVIVENNGAKVIINNHYKDTLQELIDNYSKLDKIHKLTLSRNFQLDKALDKACNELDDKYYCHKGIRISCDDENCICCIKEYLLKESEKQ